MNKAKVLVLDIETSPLVSYTWGTFDQNVALNQIKKDWFIIAFAAKWLGDPPSKVVYKDQRHAKDLSNDKPLLEVIHKLMDEADIFLTQNGKAFDVKKLNARFILNGMKPPSPAKHIDTCLLARQKFAFTSNKLEYLTDKLCKKYKKIKHSEFGGFELWSECLKGNKKAWDVMREYNTHDILSLEELYNVMAPWQTQVDFNHYNNSYDYVCNCGSSQLQKRGWNISAAGRHQRYQCLGCGAWMSDKGNKKNQLNVDKRSNLKKKI